nr:hypothetical protein [Tanacetum cinerariifolium]
MQTQESRVDMSKALGAGLVVTDCSGIKPEKHDTSSRFGNDTHAGDADSEPIIMFLLAAFATKILIVSMRATALVAAAPRPADLTSSPSLTFINQAAPSASTPSTIQETQSLVISDGVKEQF